MDGLTKMCPEAGRNETLFPPWGNDLVLANSMSAATLKGLNYLN